MGEGVRRENPREITYSLQKSSAQQPQPANYVPRETIYLVHTRSWTQRLVYLLLPPNIFCIKTDPIRRKVAIVLEELGLTYESVYLDFSKQEQKAPDYLKINPNGRIPAIIDHQNGDFAVWYVLAVVIAAGRWLTKIQGDSRDLGVLGRQVRQGPQTLQHRPGQVHRAPVARLPGLRSRVGTSFACTFQTSLRRPRSPYFGQSVWFQKLHPEKIPSAIERYNNEIKRVFGVLDAVLSKQKYLVGDKVTIADLSFIPWNVSIVTWLTPDIDLEKNYPALAR